MFQAIISVCNLINMKCVLLKDKIGLKSSYEKCIVRSENVRKDFMDLCKCHVIIKKIV